MTANGYVELKIASIDIFWIPFAHLFPHFLILSIIINMRSSHLSQMASSFREEDSFTNDLDPMLEGGYRVIYLHQCPFEIRQKSFEDGEK